MAISKELDELSCELMGEAFDRLAKGLELVVVATAMDASGVRVTCEFANDSGEQCLAAAREWVARGARATKDAAPSIGTPRYYAIAYLGAVANEGESYADALILEFGEKGAPSAFSAYSFVEGTGEGEAFRWSEPEAAGELDCLL